MAVGVAAWVNADRRRVTSDDWESVARPACLFCALSPARLGPRDANGEARAVYRHGPPRSLLSGGQPKISPCSAGLLRHPTRCTGSGRCYCSLQKMKRIRAKTRKAAPLILIKDVYRLLGSPFWVQRKLLIFQSCLGKISIHNPSRASAVRYMYCTVLLILGSRRCKGMVLVYLFRCLNLWRNRYSQM